MTGGSRKLVLKITLKSDICAASGDGFSSVVDTDVCYDADGFPYIPGRRVKGCLREAAEMLFGMQDGNVDKLFGVEPKEGRTLGAMPDAAARIGDAHLSGRNAIAADEFQGLSPSDRLGRLTMLRAQTAIGENGQAKEDTLRFIRVVRHYAPKEIESRFADGELSFEAYITLSDESLLEVLEDAARALRNIGYRRNVGFGAVSCEVLPAADDAEGCAPGRKTALGLPSGMRAISYSVRLDGPVVVPGSGGMETLPFIPGQAVMGFFAGEIWRKLNSVNPGAAQEGFDRLFLSKGGENGTASFFSPLYPTDAQGVRCMPAPPVIAKIKGGKRDGQLVSLLDYSRDEESVGETPKPLRDGFVGSDFRPVDVHERIEYHHSVRGKTLYTQRCLCEGQEFSGFVVGDSELLDRVEAVLQAGELRFGRSKSAQYARCTLVGLSRVGSEDAESEREGADSAPSAQMGSPEAPAPVLVAQLDSDVLIPDGKGGYSSDAACLGQEVLRAFGLNGRAAILLPDGGGLLTQAPGEVERAVRDEASGSPSYEDISILDRLVRGTYVQLRTVAGFNAKWCQTKPQVTAFAAGSCLVLVPLPDCELAAGIPEGGRLSFVGARRNEGFGCVRLLRADAMVPGAARDEEDDAGGGGDGTSGTGAPAESMPAAIDPVARREDGGATPSEPRDRFMACISYAREASLEGFNPTFLNRVIRMAEESESMGELCVARGEEGQPADDPKTNGDRIGSIKDDARRKAARCLVMGFAEKPGIPSAATSWPEFKEHLVFMLRFLKYRLNASNDGKGAGHDR